MGSIINIIGKKSIGCDRVAVIDSPSTNIFSHHFVIEKAMKEVNLEKMFQTMYKNDFNEAITIKLISRVMKDAEEVSSEGSRFLQIVKQKTTKAGEYYFVPLPFCSKSLDMLNNRKQAIKGLMHMKDRFKRNSSYFPDHKKFMDDLTTKVHARKEDTGSPG